MRIRGTMKGDYFHYFTQDTFTLIERVLFSYLQANDSFSNFFYFDNTCVEIQELFNYSLDMRVLCFIHLIRLLEYDDINRCDVLIFQDKLDCRKLNI